MLKILHFSLIFFSFSTEASSSKITLAELDAIVAHVSDISEFHRNKDLEQRYYQGLLNYTGLNDTRFPFSVYKAYLTEMLKLSRTVIHFHELLFAKEDLGEKFSVELNYNGKNKIATFTPARRLHGIWKGLFVEGEAECIAGSDLLNLTPLRWATVLKKMSRLYFIEDGAKFRGWFYVNPVISKTSGLIYPGLEFGSQIFAQKLSDQGHQEIFFETWLPQMIKSLPSDWQLPFIGDTNVINNAGVLPEIRSSLAFRMGQIIGQKQDFRSFDDRSFYDKWFMSDLVRESPKNGPDNHNVLARYPASDFITDASADQTQNYYQFNPEWRNIFSHAKMVDYFIGKSAQPFNHLAHLMQIHYKDPNLEKVVEDRYLRLHRWNKWRVLKELKQHAGWGILKPSELVLKYFFTNQNTLKSFFKNIPTNSQKFSKRNRSFFEFFPIFFNYVLNNYELIEMNFLLRDPLDVFKMAGLQIRSFAHAREYLNLIRQLSSILPLQKNDELQKFIDLTSTHFFKLNPTVFEVTSLLDQIHKPAIMANLIKATELYQSLGKVSTVRLKHELERFYPRALNVEMFHGCQAALQ